MIQKQKDMPAGQMGAWLRSAFDANANVGTTADRVYAALNTGIEEGVLPPGHRLGEELLATTFGVSRTPIREAFVRLDAEGLASRDRQGNLFVSTISVENIIELYVVREALDGTSARLAATYADALDLGRLQELNDRMRDAAIEGDHDRMALLNLEFHSVLARASRNRTLEKLVAQIHRAVRRFQSTTFSYKDRSMTAVREHDELIRAIRAKEGEEAEALARAHMQSALEVRVKMESNRESSPARRD